MGGEFVSETSPYSGWKHPAVKPPRQATPASLKTTRRIRFCSSHHIDDPLRNNDHLPRRLAVQRPFDGVEGEDGSLNIDVSGVARNGYVGAFLAVDLDWERDGVLHKQVGFERG